MGYLTGLLPVAKAVAVFAALKAEADRLKASDDTRTRGQLMADTLVARVTGSTDGSRPVVPIAVNVTISADALLDGAHDDALLEAVGVIPAGAARALLAEALEADMKVWVRRLVTKPGTGELVGMDVKARLFPTALGRWLELRDQFCRNPYCDAQGRGRGRTDECGQRPGAVCGMQLRQAGTRLALQTGGRPATHRPDHTPTGHTYYSQAPPLPGTGVTATHLFIGPAFGGLDAEAC